MNYLVQYQIESKYSVSVNCHHVLRRHEVDTFVCFSNSCLSLWDYVPLAADSSVESCPSKCPLWKGVFLLRCPLFPNSQPSSSVWLMWGVRACCPWLSSGKLWGTLRLSSARTSQWLHCSPISFLATSCFLHSITEHSPIDLLPVSCPSQSLFPGKGGPNKVLSQILTNIKD